MTKKILSTLLILFSTFFTVALAEDFQPCTNMITGIEYEIPQDASGGSKYFKFTAPEDDIYVLSDKGACSGYFYIHDENKETLARSGTSEDTMSTEIIWKMSKGDVYYFSANSKYGGYTLTISPFDTESAKWIVENEEYNIEPVEQIGPCTPEVSYFSPDQDGYYCFTASGIGDSCGSAVPCNVSPIYFHNEAVSMHSEYYSYAYYFLKKDRVYPIHATCGSSGQYNTPMRYIIYNEYMDVNADYNIGDPLKVNKSASYSYYDLVPDKTSRIIIRNQDKSENYKLSLYDTITGEATYADYRYCSIECDVVANRQYYLVLEYGRYDLYSSYIGDTDNTPVTTSDVNLMQSHHYYGYNKDKIWTYHAPESTIHMDVTFSSQCELMDDTLYIYNDDGSLNSSYKGNELAGKSISLKSNSFSIRLVTNNNYIGYGFKIDNITCYDRVTPPSSNLASGTIRPSSVQLTAHPLATIYYSLNSGSYKEYTAPIDITRDSSLSVYAQIGNEKSEIITYNYQVNTSLMNPPTINIVTESDTYSLINFSSEEGNIYYKKMLSDTDYKVYTSGNIRLDTTDIIVAYTASGLLKSEYVYYSREFEEKGEYTLPIPQISVTDIDGGKRVTITAEGNFGMFSDSYNYCGEHYESQCGKKGYVHEFTDWSLEDIYSYVDITYGGEKSPQVRLFGEKNTYTFDIFDSTYIRAYTEKQNSKMVGMWHYYMPEYTDRVSHVTELPEIETTEHTYSEEYSKANFLYVEVPKASAPTISVSDGKATIEAESGKDIYYSINGGEFVKYTTSVPISSSDRITAYATGSGCTKSDEVSAFEVFADSQPAINNGTVNLTGKIKNNIGEKSAVLTAALYEDGTGRLLDIHTVPVNTNTGYTYVDDISLSCGNSTKVNLKLLLWDSFANSSPLSHVAEYTIE